MPHPKYWMAAFRLRTLPLSLSTIFAGSVAAAMHGVFRWDVLVMASLTTLFLQILSNLANDYGDGVAGTDRHRQGEQRMVQSGHISQKQMLRMIVVFAGLSLLSGLLLLALALPAIFSMRGLMFLAAGVLSIGAAINYTVGRNPYGYKGWGDFFVFVFFGLVGVYGSYYLHAAHFSWPEVKLAVAIGLLSAGVLNVNNLRDEASDRAAGKRTLVVIGGRDFGVRYHVLLLAFAWWCLVAFVTTQASSWMQWLFVLTLPLFIRHLRVIITHREPAAIDPELKRLSLATFFTVMLLVAGQLLTQLFGG